MSDPAAGPGQEPEPTLRLPVSVGAEEVPAKERAGEGGDGREGGGPPAPGGRQGPGASGADRWEPGPGEPGGGRARRFWSSRRIPAALTAAGCLALSGLFLYDVAAVRAGRKAMAWRRTLANELATRHLDNVWIIVGAAVAAALGLWLIVLAATPGERQVLPMARRGPDGVRAGLDRHAAELVLRDRAMEVAGVRWSKVSVGRRRIRTSAGSHFRELDDVRRDLTAAMESAVAQLGLARPPALRVHVQRADRKA
ncbi:DUF6286 domain-containing protein [Actinacidiphila guanduensis]|uniref:DUF6286 domain-containing protein n=1 Tax=Actinacidiphila guanduensis TaxID=310781 RepID=A0A1H0E5V5_9ACTN|nr:DUF6286 domain-containing protein [Actinacidiphila guanduensis]SDN77790.1 hypothetical protein SAMN05216259_105485 [Actinacidiphila guanduensis]